MSCAEVSRRSLLAAAVVTVGLAYGVRWHRTRARHFEAARTILTSLPHSHTFTPLGRAFLDEARPPYNVTTLIEALERRLGTTFEQLDSDSARRAILAAIEDDFDRRDLIEIQGWLIPRTSALVAAARFRVGASLQTEQYDDT